MVKREDQGKVPRGRQGGGVGKGGKKPQGWAKGKGPHQKRKGGKGAQSPKGGKGPRKGSLTPEQIREKEERIRKREQSERRKEEREISELEERILIECPPPGGKWKPLLGPEEEEGAQETSEGPRLTVGLFADLPISTRTQRGLKAGGFVQLTPIQKEAIPHALAGRDVLGEAKTGSGKTLAFIVPIVERLFRQRFTSTDGLGALILSPTRELAVQIFDVLRNVGKQHDLSAGCVIGGKDVSAEQHRIHTLNVLVATPGRLLQHMDESPSWDASNLQILVLDEADRCLDLGFRDTLSAIMRELPNPGERQTMLFSATLRGAGMQELAMMSLKNPEKLSVNADDDFATPLSLRQHYVTCPLEEKVDSLFAFLRTHSRKRVIVFVSACKQVRYLSLAFRELKTGSRILGLHGQQSQAARLKVYEEFLRRKAAVALICTDIAARGVDFPAVDWVVQMDCPENIDTYIHRVGRTARYGSSGHSLLFLTPSEEKFAEKLKASKIPIKQVKVNAKKRRPLEDKLSAMLAASQELKHTAQKALLAYTRAVCLMPDKEVFSFASLDLEAFAKSLGLASAPELPFVPSGGKGHDALAEGERGEGGFSIEHNEMKAKKNLSKLERLKLKIREKKEAKLRAKQAAEEGGVVERGGGEEGLEDEEEEDVLSEEEGMKKKLTKRERFEKRMREARERRGGEFGNGGEEEDGDEEFLQIKPKIDTLAKDAEEDAEEDFDMIRNEKVEAALKKGRIKLRRDGTAKVKGAALAMRQSLEQGGHKFFDEEEGEGDGEGETNGPSKSESTLWRLLDSREGADDAEEEEEEERENGEGGTVQADDRARFLRAMRRRLESQRDKDKETERERVREKHRKKKAKMKEAAAALSAGREGKGGGVQLVPMLAGGSDEGSHGEEGEGDLWWEREGEEEEGEGEGGQSDESETEAPPWAGNLKRKNGPPYEKPPTKQKRMKEEELMSEDEDEMMEGTWKNERSGRRNQVEGGRKGQTKGSSAVKDLEEEALAALGFDGF
uniref:ATP-dependent RNA helicase n=1 Tax=Chromera velia CCMP2878 TaxID=1169474 RepID=A0A0G4H3S2_9ALVE|eukprot:Cvel_5648.t1-p1 / transcript=Cvel_5648.t1 / gene=Cvel_5648 / organism=Chromera_velia_CCMP2878 / gene_product=Probable ATP-dependent RNA helicase DDX10, putative / transcript_product=Probable ATP-dependent RNA helicase DDX10, putative / location=Cvel_scaffold266:90545-97909(-) / protein_length=1013 / sequence_SO=supercontig / SO=protein_coding / is_pseudo=false